VVKSDARQREVIGPKWNIRFRDLCEWHIIKAKCFSCGYVDTLYPNRLKKLRLAQLKRRHRWLASSSEDHLREQIEHQHVAELEELLRCEHCGNRVNNNLRFLKLPPHA